MTLQQQLERKQQRAAAAEGDVSAFALGDSAAEPFYISNAAQLAELATLVNAGNSSFNSAHYKLLNDIDLSAYTVGATVDGVEYTTGWTPIGTLILNPLTQNPFAGTFDGQDHKNTNLTIDNSTANHQGLFGYVSATGKIQNLGVEDASVKGVSAVGGVVGYANGAVSSCYATGSVSGTIGVGGVVGFARAQTASIAIENCVALNPSVSGDNAVGAVVGATGSAQNSDFSVTVSNCYHWGGMTGTKLQIPTDGKLIELNGVLMSGSTAFAWTANGFTTDNGWTIPTTPMQLPYLTDTSYRPAMSLASTDVYKTVTLKYPLNSGNLQYSLDNTNWTSYMEDVSISILMDDDFTVYVKRGNDKATFAGSSTEGQWSGTITKNTTLTPRLLDLAYFVAGTTTTEATIALNNLTGISKDVVVVFAIHGTNNELLTSYVQKHTFAAGANETIPWAHNLGEMPANIKVFVLEANGLMPLLVKAVA